MQDPVNLLTPDLRIISITLFVLGLMVAIPIYFIVKFLRAYERRSKQIPSDQPEAATIAALQNEVEVLRAEVEQLTEAQDFTTQLLHERPIGELNSGRKNAPVQHDDKAKE
jgi:cell division protein FtsB